MKVLHAKWIVPMDGREHVIEDGGIAFEKDRIVAVDSYEKIKKEYGEAEEEFPDSVILPGLVNAHCHTSQMLARGWADDLTLLPWLKTRILPMEALMEHEDYLTASRHGYAEMLLSGITLAADFHSVRHVEAGVQAAKELGIRSAVGKIMMDKGDFPEEMLESTKESLELARRYIEKYHDENSRVQIMLAPRFALSCTDELHKGVVEIHKETGIGIHTHAAENRDEVAAVYKEHRMGNIAYLHSIGLLTERTLVAHGIWLTDEEYDLFMESKATLVTNPSANCKLASGICDVTKYLRLGINVAVGSDGPPCNNNMHIIEELRLAAFLQKVKYLDASVANAWEMLELATVRGYRALGVDGGILAPGKKADMIVINLNALHIQPAPDVVSAIVYAAKSTDVTHVIIDGEFVVKERKLTRGDEKKILADSVKHAARIREKVREYLGR